jgi:hypothetical protein
MDPGISASSIILLDLGYPNLVALLSPDLKVKEKRMSRVREGPEKEKFVKSVHMLRLTSILEKYRLRAIIRTHNPQDFIAHYVR